MAAVAAPPGSEAFLAYNKVDGYVPTLVGNWVEVKVDPDQHPSCDACRMLRRCYALAPKSYFLPHSCATCSSLQLRNTHTLAFKVSHQSCRNAAWQTAPVCTGCLLHLSRKRWRQSCTKMAPCASRTQQARCRARWSMTTSMCAFIVLQQSRCPSAKTATPPLEPSVLKLLAELLHCIQWQVL